MSGETSLAATLAFGLLAFLILFIGWRKGAFTFHPPEWNVPLTLSHVIVAFAIYFLVSSILTRIAIFFWQKEILLNFMSYSSWLNFGVSSIIFFLLALYLGCLPKNIRSSILRRSGTQEPLIEDVWAALYAWIMAFPLVLFLSQLLEMLLIKLFRLPQLPEQIAVKFLKTTFVDPLYFFLAVLSIIVLAPLIEETLFRGFLQSYIRKHLGSAQAIVITSACFSLFHYDSSQGLGNISIILSLFVLALFLGFLYEKRGSLLAPMILHGTFNAVSVVNLYLFGGFTNSL